jgi:apolipoprotein D and lipocalin family protein
MQNIYRILAVTFLVLAFAQTDVQAQAQKPLKVVNKVDLGRYLGKWYEIASIPAWFQKDCSYGTTATYSKLESGDIGVLNSCYTKDGKLKSAKGVAWVTDKTTSAKIKVSFLPFGLKLFGGDYWVIDLGPNYEYAVVGHPDRTYGWILSRTPELPKETMDGIIKRLEAQGYDFSKFKMTKTGA